MKQHVSILILGAGPTGLGAAYRLQEQKYEDYVVLEKNEYPGGLATTFTDSKGFLWDVGGHVVHSHYPYFDAVFAQHILPFCNTLQREAWAWLFNTFVPYPFQYNIHHLPEEIQKECVSGLENRKKQIRASSHPNFRTWILENFGSGIARHFLIPQNRKTWGVPLQSMSSVWVRDRVATVDLERTLKNITQKKDDVAWGPNTIFHFPQQGGTGFIWKTLSKTLPAQKMHFGSEVKKIDLKNKIVTTAHGAVYTYTHLVSSLPLTVFLKLAHSPLAHTAQKNLKFSTVHVVGLGLNGQPADKLKTKCWMYFPEKNIPFFRATVFSNYAQKNVPQPGEQWSLMFEVTDTQKSFPDTKMLIKQVIQGALDAKLIKNPKEIVSQWHHTAHMGYPIPTLSRDEVIDPLLHALQEHNVYSRGRFGAWKYEVSNMDHSFMQGVEAVNHIVHRQPEITVWDPAKANNS